MADLSSNFLGIKSPNPFWLASGPPTDKAYNVNRAFEAGWGGVSWKTLGEDPHIVNVNGPRYSTMMSNDRRVIGFNNIELITDRPFQVNLKEMRQVKRDWPDRALVASVMFPMNEASWAKHIPILKIQVSMALSSILDVLMECQSAAWALQLGKFQNI